MFETLIQIFGFVTLVEDDTSVEVSAAPRDELMKPRRLSSSLRRRSSLVPLADQRCVCTENNSFLNSTIFFVAQFVAVFELVKRVHF
jgi:hypothetical protein